MSGRGLPSWYKYRAYGPVYEEIRLAEHAVRLGSPVSFDRRGDVIWFDDFEHGLNKWFTSLWGAVGAITPSVGYTRSGGLSVRLETGVDPNAYAAIGHMESYPVLSPMGFGIAWTVGTNIRYFSFSVHICNGSQYYKGLVRYDRTNKVWQYYDENGVYQTFLSDWYPYGANDLFHIVKLVIDPEGGLYRRVLIDNQEVSLAAVPLQTGASATLSRLDVGYSITPSSGANGIGYADDAIITQNEP